MLYFQFPYNAITRKGERQAAQCESDSGTQSQKKENQIEEHRMEVGKKKKKKAGGCLESVNNCPAARVFRSSVSQPVAF